MAQAQIVEIENEYRQTHGAALWVSRHNATVAKQRLCILDAVQQAAAQPAQPLPLLTSIWNVLQSIWHT